ncbi:ATP-dependent DNA ligase [Hydrogenophaga sp. IBVHS2]|uniref:ATP-dependent DNA ligase n=1 Tax=Hydrogenophaga sp. IBVHS2 TaxID=1985170 RepID=UPI000A2ED21A|nr:ATP-dependent DNA ligase [Hydrogenophaga sp. IBVHS2]OSZ62932.1 ATP-dependent DNA ligase [Hydrogenophaga sp. IBVHS2]
MKDFADLYAELDATTSTQAKVAALVRHFARVGPADAAWAAYFLSGGKPRQLIRTAQLRALATEAAGLPDWLFEASYQAVGDLAETIALVLPPPDGTAGEALGLADWMAQRLLPLRGQDEAAVAAQLRAWWRELGPLSRFLLIKLVGGGFRVGVSKLLVQRAVAEHAGLDPKLVAARMMGYTDGRRLPQAEDWQRITALTDADGPAGPTDAAPSQPYPFFLAQPLQDEPSAVLGVATDWRAEWKFDGIRGQIVRRGGQTWVWSRGEELMTDRFPELQALAAGWPDGTVVDGEIVVWDESLPPLPGIDRPGRPAGFAVLQQRIGRQKLTASVLARAPVGFVAYDLLEQGGVDLRGEPLDLRRERLQDLAAAVAPRLWLSPLHRADDWATLARRREQSRDLGVEGLMLKHRASTYGVGRHKQTEGDQALGWWKWKIDPLTVDGVLIYAQAGHGRRASVYTDYTFAVWNRPPRDAAEAQAVVEAIAARQPPAPDGLQLVAFTKAYSGLTDEVFKAVDAVIRKTTLEKFGPVRSVRPTLVFELAFEGIARSSRHKSGVALRFPRMLRLRTDKPLHEAGTLPELESLLR